MPEKLPLSLDFANSRLRLKNCPFFRESGYDRGVRFGRELGAGDYRPKLAAQWLKTLVLTLPYIINLSFNEGVFPFQLKIAQILALNMNSDPTQLKNYRL